MFACSALTVKEEFLNTRVVDHYQNSNDRRKFNDKMLNKGIIVNEELRLKRKDGALFIGSVSTVAVKDDVGKTLFYDGLIMDVTEQKQAKDALLESEVKFRSLFDLSPEAIALVHRESSSIVDVNDKFCQLFKFQREDIIGKSPVDLGLYTKTKRNQFTSNLEKTGKLIGFKMNFTAGDGSVLNTHHVFPVDKYRGRGIYSDNFSRSVRTEKVRIAAPAVSENGSDWNSGRRYRT